MPSRHPGRPAEAPARRRSGPIQEVIYSARPGVPAESAGFILRWGAPPLGGADLEAATGRLAGFLVADGPDGSGGHQYAAYRAQADPDRAAELLTRHGTVEQGLAAILGTPPAPYARYGTRVPVVQFVGQRTAEADGSMFCQYEGPGRRRVEIKVRDGSRGAVLHTRRGAAAAARRQLGLTPAASRDPEPEM